jgi:hypothetical protein
MEPLEKNLQKKFDELDSTLANLGLEKIINAYSGGKVLITNIQGNELSVEISITNNNLIVTHIKGDIYISPQINRAVKNKSYFYNCYGKEEEFYIENQG